MASTLFHHFHHIRRTACVGCHQCFLVQYIIPEISYRKETCYKKPSERRHMTVLLCSLPIYATLASYAHEELEKSSRQTLPSKQQ
jgi:hypothetical protein